RTGYTFAGWNTEANGSGTSYAAAATLTMDVANVTLYAQWTANPTYKVTYNGNGSTGGTAPTDSGTYETGTTATVLSKGSLVRTGYTFAGWNTEANGSGTSYAAAATLTMGMANVTLYAQWTANPSYKVLYNDNGSTGGTVPTDSGAYEQNTTVTVLGNTGSLVRTGYAFAGWNTEANGSGTSYAAGAAFTMGLSNVSLYAQWKTIPASDDGSGGGGIPTPVDSKVISKNGELLLPAGKAGEVSLGDGIKIDIPANATEKDMKLTIKKLLETHNLHTKNEVLASPVYEVVKSFTEKFKKTITLTLTFDPASLKNNQKAAIFYYDEVKKKWVEIGGIVNGNKISVEVDQLRKYYAVLAVDEPSQEEVRFSDISGHWAEANFIQAVTSGMVGGYPDGMFKPNHTVTRAEFAVMLMNAQKPQRESAALMFTDTEKIPAWAQKAVAQAVEAGIVNGYADGTFRPNAEITRAEMAAMIVSSLKLTIEENEATGFADDKSIPSWSRGAAAVLRQLGIMEGSGANRFNSDAKATRAEAVTIILRMVEHQSK
ncbi:MAG: S-layer homology domain-containing protein, partial [Candidatus Pristimantibacillus sp.]